MQDTYIQTENGIKFPIPNATLSTGDSLDVSSRYSHDATKTSQSITWRRRNTALGASLRFSATASELASEGYEICDYIASISALCRFPISLFWYGREYRNFIVKSVQITPEIDAITTFSSVQIGLELGEGYVAKKTKYTAVRAL